MFGKKLTLEEIQFPTESFKTKFNSEIIFWGRKNFSAFPWRTSCSRFHALIAELMLQRTKAEQVEPIFVKFQKKYPTIESAYNDLNGVSNLLYPLGLAWRVRKIIELIKELQFTDIPNDLEKLVVLPGVGKYSASVFRSCHLGYREAIIDTNIVRIYGRVFGFQVSRETRRKKKFFKIADFMTPEKEFREYNYGLLDFSRIICKIRPQCVNCPIIHLCESKETFNT